MDILYPSTKFYIPRSRKNIVRRQRLFDRLNEGIHGKLVTICAPAGYGKTTLVTSWLPTLDMPIAWVSADEADNDIYRFCLCLLEALCENHLFGGEKLRQMLQSAAPPSQDSLAMLFVNEIARIRDDCVVVIDDYHLVSNPAVHSAFHTIVEQAPRQLHFVVCSRTDPPFPVSKLRAQSELLELNQHELSLTLEESSLYLNMVMGSGLKAGDIAALHERTEGWLVGLQLAALSIRDQQDPSAFIRGLKGDNRYIADYLVDEVLARIPTDLQDFLLRTSALSEMTAALCNFVLQVHYSQDLLESLDRKRLFIIPLDENRQAFRYHHLFREMLFDRLRRKAPGSVKRLYQRASTWYSLGGSKETAVEYALLAGDATAVKTLLGEIGPQMLYRGNWSRLLGWYDRLPEPVFLSSPELWLNYLMTLINAGAIITLAQMLDKMEAQDLATTSLPADERAITEANLAAVRGVAHLHSRADPLAARKCLSFAREHLPPVVNINLIFAEVNYGVACLLSGDLQEARAALRQANAWARQSNVSLGVVIGTAYEAEAAAMSGNLHAAHELLQSTARYAQAWGVQEGAVFAKASLELGRLYYEWNELDLALHYLTDGISLAEQGGYLDQLLLGYVHLTRVQSLRGDANGIKESLGRLRRVLESYGDPPLAFSFFEAVKSDLALQHGENGIASRWLDRYQAIAPNESTLFCEYQNLVLARAHKQQNDDVRVCELVKPMRELAASQGRVASVISYDVIIAKCLFMSGEPESALEILENALALAEAGQFIRTFLDEGGVVISMIKQLLAARGQDGSGPQVVSLEYLHILLDEAAKQTVKVSRAAPKVGGADGLVPLTTHELKILQLLESGYTNKQISNELSISLNTVKFHLKNIYGKMGVTNRTQASRALRDHSE